MFPISFKLGSRSVDLSKQIVTLIIVGIVALIVISLLLKRRSSRNKAPTLHETAISVKTMIGIGELITAEYYGEVLGSLDEVRQETEGKYIEARSKLKSRYNRMKQKADGTKYRRASKALRDWPQGFMKDTLGIQLVDRKAYYNTVRARTWDRFYQKFEDNIEQYLSTQFEGSFNKRSKLVYIGRGSVKAGFSFDYLDPWLVALDTNRVIHIFNWDPIMFDVDINPWFIPEDSVFGYELVRMEGEKKLTFKDVTAVKVQCKQRLRDDALTRRIYHLATQNAEETLLGFFELFGIRTSAFVDEALEEDQQYQYKSVKIHHGPYFKARKEILVDYIIDEEDVKIIQEFVKNDTVGVNPDYFPVTYFVDAMEEDEGKAKERWGRKQKKLLAFFIRTLEDESKPEWNSGAWKLLYNELRRESCLSEWLRDTD